MPKIPDLKVWIYEPQYIIRKCWAPALMSQLTNTPTLMPGDLLVSELLVSVPQNQELEENPPLRRWGNVVPISKHLLYVKTLFVNGCSDL